MIGQVLSEYSTLYHLHLCLSCVSQLLEVTVSIRGARGYFESVWGRGGVNTYLAPPVGFPAGASPGSAGLFCPGTWQMTAVIFLYLGLVWVNTGYLPLLGPTATAHRTLERTTGRKNGNGGSECRGSTESFSNDICWNNADTSCSEPCSKMYISIQHTALLNIESPVYEMELLICYRISWPSKQAINHVWLN